MLFESINYYLGWVLVTRNNIAILWQLYQLVGLEVMARTEAFAFLTGRIAISLAGSGVGSDRNDSGEPPEYQSLSCGFSALHTEWMQSGC